MPTIVEKDSPVISLILLTVLLLILLTIGLGIAYMSGAFSFKKHVIANNQRMVDQASVGGLARGLQADDQVRTAWPPRW